MNWLSELLYKINNFDSLQEKLTSSEEEVKLLTLQLALAIEDCDDFRVENQKLNDKLQSLNEELDIQSLREWYESRRIQHKWVWDGARLGDIDVKYYLRVESKDEPLMAEAAKEIITKYNLSSDSKIENVVASLMKFFIPKSQWTYKFDKDKHKVEDYWQYAPNSWKERSGDCDDLAILIHVLWDFILRELSLSEHYWRLTFSAGTLVSYGGHAFNTFLHKDGEYYVVESTYDLKNSFYKTWLNTPIRFNNLYKKFYGFATKEESWSGTSNNLGVYNP